MAEAPSASGPGAAQGAAISQPLRRPSMVLGGLLVLIGAILLAGQFVRVEIWHYGWPLFVIAPGVLLLILALTARGFAGEGLAIAGSVITVIGLILLYQNTSGHFESWAYAWALIPASVGAGMMLYGWVAHRPANVRVGTRLLATGLVIFLLGVLFFEGALGLGGYHFDRNAGVVLGVVIIAVGALMLIRTLT